MREREEDDWIDERYTCDNCGEDGRGKYYSITMRGWKPICICEDCMERMAVEND